MRLYRFTYEIEADSQDEARERLAELIAQEGFLAPMVRLGDVEALDRLNLLLSAAEWPGASGMEDVCEIVRATGRTEVPNAPYWERH